MTSLILAIALDQPASHDLARQLPAVPKGPAVPETSWWSRFTDIDRSKEWVRRVLLRPSSNSKLPHRSLSGAQSAGVRCLVVPLE